MKKDQIIVALDFPSERDALNFVDEMGASLSFVKVGMELFFSTGIPLLNKLKAKNLKIFLDLKLHDIPNTVANAMKTLAQLKVDMINVHTSGGIHMMEQACDAYKQIHPEGKLIGVTQLTSTSQTMLNQELKVPGALLENVVSLARNAYAAGLDGVVCSALEAQSIKENIKEDFLCVTPGIRLNPELGHDQKRVATPYQAIKNGADFLVVGRDITLSNHPTEVFQSYLEEIQ
jgi:orotidine-5'-phosphate decarboxylase